MKTLIATLTLGALVATPVLAHAKSHHGHAGKAAYHVFASVTPVDTREAAVHDCSTKSRQYTETTWGDMQMHQFRTCMMQHGQPE